MDEEEKKQDIFDWVIAHSMLRVFEPVYQKNKEILLYLFFGGMTFGISVVTFMCFQRLIGNALAANILSWVVAVGFAYVTNRDFVFQAKVWGKGRLAKQAADFFAARILTLLMEEAILFVLITRMGFHSVAVKVFGQIVVIIVNYVLSKHYIFR